MTPSSLSELLKRSELRTLDFKLEPYDFAGATPEEKNRKRSERAIISSSSVRMTRTVTRLKFLEITAAVFALRATYSVRCRGYSVHHRCLRECSTYFTQTSSLREGVGILIYGHEKISGN
jgi:hypothetical protein